MKPTKRKVGPWTFVSINETVRETIELVEQAHLGLRKIHNPPSPFETEWQVLCASGKYSFFVKFRDSPFAFVNELDLPRWASLCEVAVKRDQARREAQAITRSKLRVV